MPNNDLIRGGTASVAAGATAVTGQSVSWSAVVEGDFFGAHVGLAVPIEAIAGPTLKLAYPWPGPGQTAAPYAIQPKGDSVRFAATLRDVLLQLADGDLAAIAALPTAADTLAYFTGPGAADLAVFKSVGRAFLAANFMPVQQAGGIDHLVRKVMIGWSGAHLKAQVDDYDLGSIWTDVDAPGSLLGSVGWHRLPNGWIEQYGYIPATGDADIAVTFPTAFPNIFRGASLAPIGYPDGVAYAPSYDLSTRTSMAIRRRLIGSGGAISTPSPSYAVAWKAWGN